MLQKLDKFGPLALLLLLGYLTYTTVYENRPALPKGKDLPEVTNRMLNPKLLVPQAHASPVDRDPFEVEWASYRKPPLPLKPTSRPTTAPATRPAATQPTERPAPPLPERLTGVFLGRDLRIAVLGEKIYKVGSTIGGKDPRTCWQIEAIERNSVTIRFGRHRRVLRITSRRTPPTGPAGDGWKEGRR